MNTTSLNKYNKLLTIENKMLKKKVANLLFKVQRLESMITLSLYNLKELRKIATEINLKNRSKMKKEKLLEVINKLCLHNTLDDLRDKAICRKRMKIIMNEIVRNHGRMIVSIRNNTVSLVRVDIRQKINGKPCVLAICNACGCFPHGFHDKYGRLIKDFSMRLQCWCAMYIEHQKLVEIGVKCKQQMNKVIDEIKYDSGDESDIYDEEVKTDIGKNKLQMSKVLDEINHAHYQYGRTTDSLDLFSIVRHQLRVDCSGEPKELFICNICGKLPYRNRSKHNNDIDKSVHTRCNCEWMIEEEKEYKYNEDDYYVYDKRPERHRVAEILFESNQYLVAHHKRNEHAMAPYRDFYHYLTIGGLLKFNKKKILPSLRNEDRQVLNIYCRQYNCVFDVKNIIINYLTEVNPRDVMNEVHKEMRRKCTNHVIGDILHNGGVRWVVLPQQIKKMNSTHFSLFKICVVCGNVRGGISDVYGNLIVENNCSHMPRYRRYEKRDLTDSQSRILCNCEKDINVDIDGTCFRCGIET